MDGGAELRLRRVVGIVGNLVGILALGVAVGAVAFLLRLTAGGDSISSVFPEDRSGTGTIAFPTLMAFLSMTGFFFGQFAVRGRWGTGGDSRFSSGSFRVDLRPISGWLHVLLLLAALAAWALVMALPVRLDALGRIDPGDGSSAAEQFWFTVTVYGTLGGALAAMVAVSLLKKLTYNRALKRSGNLIRPGSATQLTWRLASHIWRAELGVAALAGAALGLAPLGIHLGSAAYGLWALGLGAVLLLVSIATALNSWRSGLPVERVESHT
jgi:hypothetical protein